MLEINDNTFDTDVLASQVPVLVDFGAEWCGPCKASKPHVEALAAQAQGFQVAYVDIDRSPKTAQRCMIKGVPTFAVFVGGRAVAKHVGMANGNDLLQLLHQASQAISR